MTEGAPATDHGVPWPQRDMHSIKTSILDARSLNSDTLVPSKNVRPRIYKSLVQNQPLNPSALFQHLAGGAVPSLGSFEAVPTPSPNGEVAAVSV